MLAGAALMSVSSPVLAVVHSISSSSARRYVRVPNEGSQLFLWYFQAPKTCYNFLQLAKAGKYNNVLFHRLVPGFMVRACSTCLSGHYLNARADPNRRPDRNWFRR